MRYVIDWQQFYANRREISLEEVHDLLRKTMFCMELMHNEENYPEDFAFVCPPLGDLPGFAIVYQVSHEAVYEEDSEEYKSEVATTWYITDKVIPDPNAEPAVGLDFFITKWKAELDAMEEGVSEPGKVEVPDGNYLLVDVKTHAGPDPSTPPIVLPKFYKLPDDALVDLPPAPAGD